MSLASSYLSLRLVDRIADMYIEITSIIARMKQQQRSYNLLFFYKLSLIRKSDKEYKKLCSLVIKLHEFECSTIIRYTKKASKYTSTHCAIIYGLPLVIIIRPVCDDNRYRSERVLKIGLILDSKLSMKNNPKPSMSLLPLPLPPPFI